MTYSTLYVGAGTSLLGSSIALGWSVKNIKDKEGKLSIPASAILSTATTTTVLNLYDNSFASETDLAKAETITTEAYVESLTDEELENALMMIGELEQETDEKNKSL